MSCRMQSSYPSPRRAQMVISSISPDRAGAARFAPDITAGDQRLVSAITGSSPGERPG
ncbi:hypothetical protein RGR602_CH03570 [Rhizobium gallicum bv. gallicum R602sp]|uniref:Uncharacterized protein n=1 Tax=Rhizobium gallicum bv. gallicum R602sp TaxID=1041138 RepID=A0A0B4X8N8_9HYPH|nr:hypothetical protein RGR602_CH03570 [Rhizobium gallicum bv. gallicum R602sp]